MEVTMEVAITQRCERWEARPPPLGCMHGEIIRRSRPWRPYEIIGVTSVLGCNESLSVSLREGDGGVEGEREHEGGVEVSVARARVKVRVRMRVRMRARRGEAGRGRPYVGLLCGRHAGSCETSKRRESVARGCMEIVMGSVMPARMRARPP